MLGLASGLTVRIRFRVWARVRFRFKVSFRVSVRARVTVGVRAKWATEESPKHPMAAYVWVYFKLKYTRYIFEGIFCHVYFVRFT